MASFQKVRCVSIQWDMFKCLGGSPHFKGLVYRTVYISGHHYYDLVVCGMCAFRRFVVFSLFTQVATDWKGTRCI